MEIRQYEYLEGAGKAAGLAVIIDVFRAFSTACYLYGQGAERVYAAGLPEDAFALRERMPGLILAGERNEKKIKGFDFGNTPAEIIKHDLHRKQVVLTTSAGTAGLMEAKQASVRITGSFVNAGAIVKYIHSLHPETVSLVAMGYNAHQPADEDRLCAGYLQEKLRGEEPDWKTMEKIIRKGTGQRFFDPQNLNSPEEDYHLCLNPDRFDFVLRAEPFDEKYLLLEKITP